MIKNSTFQRRVNAKKTRSTLLKTTLNNTRWPDGSVLKFVVMGLSGAGKSSCLDFINEGSKKKDKLRVPTLSFVPYRFDFGRIKMIFMDAPGQEAYWETWEKYLQNINGIIFVIDSSEIKDLSKVNYLLNNIISLEKDSVPIAFFVNKRDKEQSLSSFSISALLDFKKLRSKDREIKAFDTSAVDGKGFHQSLSWLLAEAYANQQQKKIN